MTAAGVNGRRKPLAKRDISSGRQQKFSRDFHTLPVPVFVPPFLFNHDRMVAM